MTKPTELVRLINIWNFVFSKDSLAINNKHFNIPSIVFYDVESDLKHLLDCVSKSSDMMVLLSSPFKTELEDEMDEICEFDYLRHLYIMDNLNRYMKNANQNKKFPKCISHNEFQSESSVFICDLEQEIILNLEAKNEP